MLPVLPALLSAGATGGRRRPLGIVLGLAVTFTITIVGLAKVVDGVGLGDSLVRDLAIAALLMFGLAVAIPRLGDRLEAPLSRLARFGPKTAGRGFWSGLAVGAALGFVYAPCAGPVLAAVVSVSAASGRTVAVGLAYALGSSVVLLVLALERPPPRPRALRGPALTRSLGDGDGPDRGRDGLPARHPLPDRDRRPPARRAGQPDALARDLQARLRASSPSCAGRRASSTTAAKAAALEDLGAAPDFTGNDRWFNSEPLTLAGLRGRVVLIDFWTYTCINCIRTLPHLVAWDKPYRDAGLTIVGVHTPEFGFEKKASNVERAIKQNGIATRSPRTTSSRPGTPGATSTGPRST